MKIAVTYENEKVFQHFGRTEQFKIYNVEDGHIMSAAVIGSNGAGHEALADVLAAEGIDILICGGLGSGAQAALADAGIEVVSGANGYADEVVEAYLAGDLKSAGINCCHHHDGEGEHEHCGHHGEAGHRCPGHGPENNRDEQVEAAAEAAAEAEDEAEIEAETRAAEEELTAEDEGWDESEGGCGGSCGSCEGGCGGGCGSRPQIIYEGKNAGKTCKVHYRGTFNDGTQFDSSFDRGEPLTFICGAGMMIPGFDKAVLNMEVGQEIDIHLTADEAYGESDPEAIFTIDVHQMPGSEELKKGVRVYLQAPDGRPFPVTVTEREGDSITFDANPEMAGKELNFHILLVEAY